jgi:hypothetical protein
MPHRFMHMSGSVVTTALDNSRSGVMVTDIRGIITPAMVEAMRRDSLMRVAAAPALVIRMERAVFAMERIPDLPTDLYAIASAPASVIVRPDQYEFWQEYSDRLMRDAGVLRAVFLEKNEALALRWAEGEALAVSGRSRSAPRTGRAASKPDQQSHPARLQASLRQS